MADVGDAGGLAGVPSDNTTLVEVLRDSRDAGFDGDFWVVPGESLRCGRCHEDHPASEICLHGVRRLEGASDPDDMLAVLWLECPACSLRGTAVVNYGPESGEDEAKVLLAVEDRRPRF